MDISKKGSLGLVLSSVALITSGYFAYRRYRYFKEDLAELGCVPWDVPPEYTSWKRYFTDVPTKSKVSGN
tara:strand:- start:329 stop:538 length:210 start_codon:yes stop_codon:yes gene_type:complete